MNDASLTIAASFAVALAGFAAFVAVLLWCESRVRPVEPLAPADACTAPAPQLPLAPPPHAPIPVPPIGRVRHAVIVMAFLVWSLAVSDHLLRH